jgi:glycosyltransferase involved in cell wall biosynthesis
MDCSIIIPTLNEEHYIGDLLDCLVNQVGTKIEIIVVDAHSVDKTTEIVKQKIVDSSQVSLRLVDAEKRGVSAQRNLGARLAESERLLFLDADVQVKPNFLEVTLKELAKRGLQLATCKFEPMSTRVDDKMLYAMASMYIATLQYIEPVSMGWCIFSTKTAHSAIGGFDEEMKFGEDYDYVVRAKRAGYKLKVLQNGKVYISVRRLDAEGRLNYYKKAVFAEIYRHFNGKIDKELFSYEFGNFQEDVEAKRYEKQQEMWNKIIASLKLDKAKSRARELKKIFEEQ